MTYFDVMQYTSFPEQSLNSAFSQINVLHFFSEKCVDYVYTIDRRVGGGGHLLYKVGIGRVVETVQF